MSGQSPEELAIALENLEESLDRLYELKVSIAKYVYWRLHDAPLTEGPWSQDSFMANLSKVWISLTALIRERESERAKLL